MVEHIRIGDVAPRVHYVADGVQTGFTYPFPIFAEGDLEVRLDGLVQAARGIDAPMSVKRLLRPPRCPCGEGRRSPVRHSA